MRAYSLAVLFVATILLFGCTTANQKSPAEKCIALCMQSTNLSNGPCLSNQIAPDWVCDVAHNPRQEIDNDPANQCDAFGTSASHFVEVTPDCELLTIY